MDKVSQKRKESPWVYVTIAIGTVILLSMIIAAIPPKTKDCEQNTSEETRSRIPSFEEILAKNYMKDYLKSNLKDPSSYEEVGFHSEYSPSRGCYLVLIKYRANNSFGGKTIGYAYGSVRFENNQAYVNIERYE